MEYGGGKSLSGMLKKIRSSDGVGTFYHRSDWTSYIHVETLYLPVRTVGNIISLSNYSSKEIDLVFEALSEKSAFLFATTSKETYAQLNQTLQHTRARFVDEIQNYKYTNYIWLVDGPRVAVDGPKIGYALPFNKHEFRFGHNEISPGKYTVMQGTGISCGIIYFYGLDLVWEELNKDYEELCRYINLYNKRTPSPIGQPSTLFPTNNVEVQAAIVECGGEKLIDGVWIKKGGRIVTAPFDEIKLS